MRPRAAPSPACTCPAARGASGHVATCALALHALRNMGGRPPAGARRGVGRPRKLRPAVSCGITFDSILEREVFDVLMERRRKVPGSEVLRRPRFDLWRSWHEGMGTKPLCFTPDFLFVRPRDVRALELQELENDVTAETSGEWAETWLHLFDVEVHEAKTSKSQESRDYPVRMAAFRAEHPTWPVFEWRRPEGKKSGKTCDRLPDTSSAPAPAGGA